MSKLLHLPFLLLLPLLSRPRAGAASSHHHHLRSLHFSLFQQETINKTGYIVVDGVAGAGVARPPPPFGTIFVFNDGMTVTPNASSRVAGIAEGTSITSSLDGLRSVSFAKITLRIRGLQGSISIVGGTHNIKPADHPVVGGTGDFMFVGGYVRSSPVDLEGVTVVYKIEFHLYWPPYAANGPSK